MQTSRAPVANQSPSLLQGTTRRGAAADAASSRTPRAGACPRRRVVRRYGQCTTRQTRPARRGTPTTALPPTAPARPRRVEGGQEGASTTIVLAPRLAPAPPARPPSHRLQVVPASPARHGVTARPRASTGAKSRAKASHAGALQPLPPVVPRGRPSADRARGARGAAADSRRHLRPHARPASHLQSRCARRGRQPPRRRRRAAGRPPPRRRHPRPSPATRGAPAVPIASNRPVD